jgi:hypothetical protein
LARGQVLERLPKVANANVEPQLRAYNRVAVLRAATAFMFCAFGFTANQAGASCLPGSPASENVRVAELGASCRGRLREPLQIHSFRAGTQSEKEAIVSWQAVMRAMANNDADAYAPLIADEFTATDTHHDRPYTKSDRLAQIKKLSLAAALSRPPALTSARMSILVKR